MDSNKIHQASTTVLLKIGTESSWPSEVLLVKRSASAKFLPNAHVFPGGRVNESDLSLANILVKDHFNMSRIATGFASDIKTASMHAAAAIRETHGESGVSLIKDATDYLDAANFLNVPNLENIWPLSWWITPEGEAQRFDTWFFLALVDQEQSFPPSGEVLKHQWIKPKDALSAHKKQDIFLAPPTRAILERMSQTSGLSDFLSYVDQPLRPIRPYFINKGETDNPTLVLPGDPLHHEPKRLNLPMFTRYSFY